MKLAKGWKGMQKRMEVALDNLKDEEVANFAFSIGKHMQRTLDAVQNKRLNQSKRYDT